MDDGREPVGSSHQAVLHAQAGAKATAVSVVGQAVAAGAFGATLKTLEVALDAALRAEEATCEGLCGGSDSLSLDDEPESEEPIDVEAAVEAALVRLEREILQLIAAPQNGDDTKSLRIGDESQQLPDVVQGLIALLRKAWRLAGLRQRPEAPDVLEITLARLTAARKCIKQKDWELADARRRLQQLEKERSTQEHRLRQLQTAAEREGWERAEAERRISEFKSEVDADAANTRDELRLRLAATEQKFDDAQEELVVVRGRFEEACVVGVHRDAELQAELSESRCCTEALEQRLAKKVGATKRVGGSRIVSSSAISSSSMAALQAATAASIAGASSESTKQVAAEPLDPFLKVPALGQGDAHASLQFSSSVGGGAGQSAGGRSSGAGPSGFGAFGDELRSVAERRASRGQRFARSGLGRSDVREPREAPGSGEVRETQALPQGPVPPSAGDGHVSANAPITGLARQSSAAKVPTNLRSLSSLLAGGARFGN